jgi:SRSO17 transposase
MRLFLPESWDADEVRRSKSRIPDDVHHREKLKIVLDMLDERAQWGLADKVVLADAAYGDCRQFRFGLDERGFQYVVSISSTTTVWADGRLPTSPEQRRQQKAKKLGRPVTAWGRDLEPETVKQVALQASEDQWQVYTWKNGDGEQREGRFLAKRVRHAYRACNGVEPGNEQWLLIQWNEDHDEPSHYWLSTLPSEESVGRLIYLAKLRWRIERDYQEMKGELGLDHFEGRTWSGFHHHCALVAAAHAFLALERALFPPVEAHAAGIPPTPPGRPAPRARSLPDVSTRLHAESCGQSAAARVSDVIKSY